MFETKKELREKIEHLEDQLAFQMRYKDKYCEDASRLRDEVSNLKCQNAMLTLQLAEKSRKTACCCKRREPERPMTLGEFDKAMEKIADKHGLELRKFKNSNIKREYHFINPRIMGAVLWDDLPYPHCGRCDITILIDEFAVPESQLKNIKDAIVRNCF